MSKKLSFELKPEEDSSKAGEAVPFLVLLLLVTIAGAAWILAPVLIQSGLCQELSDMCRVVIAPLLRHPIPLSR